MQPTKNSWALICTMMRNSIITWINRMVDSILGEANMTGSRDEHLPHPLTGQSLSKADNATDDERPSCEKSFCRTTHVWYGALTCMHYVCPQRSLTIQQ